MLPPWAQERMEDMTPCSFLHPYYYFHVPAMQANITKLLKFLRGTDIRLLNLELIHIVLYC